MVGTSTTWKVESAKPCTRGSYIEVQTKPILQRQQGNKKKEKYRTWASTGTNVPAKNFVSIGVMKIAPSVEAVVISTDRATSPWAM